MENREQQEAELYEDTKKFFEEMNSKFQTFETIPCLLLLRKKGFTHLSTLDNESLVSYLEDILFHAKKNLSNNS